MQVRHYTRSGISETKRNVELKDQIMKYTLHLALFALMIFQSCSEDSLCLTGSGSANNYPLELADFDRVSLLGPINLRVTQGSVQEVVVFAEPEMFAPLAYSVQNGTLEIGYEDNVGCFETELGVWVNITVTDLRYVHASGINEIESSGDLNLNKLRIKTSGTSSINISGNIAEQILDGSGVMAVENFDLETQSTAIDITGAGELEVHCTESLDIDVSGSATISYKGHPNISQNASGSLVLVDAN